MSTCSPYGFYLSKTDGHWLMVPAGREQRPVWTDDPDAATDDPSAWEEFLEFIRSLVGTRWLS